MASCKKGEKRRKERNVKKLEEFEDSAERKGRTREQKKYIGAHVSIVGKKA